MTKRMRRWMTAVATMIAVGVLVWLPTAAQAGYSVRTLD
jgi:hypothetical protein